MRYRQFCAQLCMFTEVIINAQNCPSKFSVLSLLLRRQRLGFNMKYEVSALTAAMQRASRRPYELCQIIATGLLLYVCLYMSSVNCTLIIESEQSSYLSVLQKLTIGLSRNTHSWVMYLLLHNYAGFYTCVTVRTILYASSYNIVRSYVQIVRNYVRNCT